MNGMAFRWVLAALLTVPLAAQKISHGPRELGVAVLQELIVKEDKVVIRVGSGGCTDKDSIRANVRKEKGLTERAPHYVVTFERVRIDECKALLSEGALLEYDIPRDLGLAGLYTLSITNWVFPRSEESIVNERMLKRSLLSATTRALETEIRGCEEKLKTAASGIGPAGNVAKFRAQAEQLKSRLETFQKMEPFDYPLPPVQAQVPDVFAEGPACGPVTPPLKKTVTVLVQAPCREGSLLELEGMTRSGPFYRIAGMAGGDYGRLKPGHKYELTVYLVYKRESLGFIPDYHVYIADAK